jgi:hypothetical protein
MTFYVNLYLCIRSHLRDYIYETGATYVLLHYLLLNYTSVLFNTTVPC